MRKVYSISFSDERVIKRLNEVQSKSHYLKDLILQDVEGIPFSDEQITYIRKMIDEKLNGYTPVLSENDEEQEETANAIDDLLNNF